MLTVAVLSALAAGAAAHVTMYPSLANPESEYNKWVFRVPYGCEDVDPDGGPSTYYPMERMEAHVPKELVDSFVRVEWVSGWPAEMDMEVRAPIHPVPTVRYSSRDRVHSAVPLHRPCTRVDTTPCTARVLLSPRRTTSPTLER